MIKKRAYLFCILFYTGMMVAFGADTLDDRRLERGSAISLTPYSEWCEDTTRALTAVDLLRHPEWMQSPGEFHERSRTGIYWVRTAVVNRGEMPLNVGLSFSNLSLVDLYLGRGSGEGDGGSTLQHRKAGTFRPAGELQAGDGREWLVLNIPPHEGYTLLLRVYHTKHYWPDLSFYARREGPFRQAMYVHRIIDALIMGAVAILFLYSLLSWLISFYRPYLWLLLFVGASGLYSFSMGGYFIDLLTPGSPEKGWLWNIHLIHAGTIAALILLIDFWRMNQRWPALYKLLKAIILGLGIASLLSFLIDYFTSNYAAMNNLNLLFMTICVVSAAYVMVRAWPQLRRPERILGYGYAIYMLGYFICIVLWAVLHERAMLVTAYFSNIAMLCVILLFSIALKEELRLYEKEKNKALRQLNDLRQEQNLMLEKLVMERTRDLKFSNEALVQKQSQLEDRNQRIETLMQEVRHRVKNNLQLLYGLMKLQLPDISDLPAKEVLMKMISRVRAMSIVNEILYADDDDSLLLLRDFIRETAAHVSMMYDVDQQADLRLDLEEDIAVPANFAIPFGLILTELLTNSLKYTLGGDGRISIDIYLRKAADGWLQFEYRNNICGPSVLPGEEKGFSGLNLVRDLVRQLHGRMESWIAGGWCYRIEAPVGRRN